MKIALNTIRKIVAANLTNKTRPISLRSLTFLSDYLTAMCAELTKEAEKLLLETNEFRKKQGLNEKLRISENLLKEVLESKNNGKNN